MKLDIVGKAFKLRTKVECGDLPVGCQSKRFAECRVRSVDVWALSVTNH